MLLPCAIIILVIVFMVVRFFLKRKSPEY